MVRSKAKATLAGGFLTFAIAQQNVMTMSDLTISTENQARAGLKYAIKAYCTAKANQLVLLGLIEAQHPHLSEPLKALWLQSFDDTMKKVHEVLVGDYGNLPPDILESLNPKSE